MASPLARGINTAIKRTHSQDSLRRSETPGSAKEAKTDEASEPRSEAEESSLPAFLRQSKTDINAKFNELNWQEKIRIIQGRNDPSSFWAQDSSAHVLQRNRYLGVQPWNRSRIKLKVDEGTSDYINASPISLVNPMTRLETKYIATQGPKKSGVSHFWQMIWHETEEVAVIVMLTPTEEAGREKCYQYFPLDASSEPLKVTSSGLPEGPAEGEVTFVESEDLYGPSTTVRKLHLTFDSQVKVVWHLLYTAFPDFGVPEDEDRVELLDLLKLSTEKNTRPGNPRTIHCSAGVGRSGTFIALEYLLALLEVGAVVKVREDEDPIYDLVRQLREQRMMMVQSDVQYQFLYDVLAEELQKQQMANLFFDQPSPKLRKMNDGMKAAALDDLEESKRNGTPAIEIIDCDNGSKEEQRSGQDYEHVSEVRDPSMRSTDHDKDGHKRENASTIDIGAIDDDSTKDKPGLWSSIGRPFVVISSVVVALITGAFGTWFLA